MPLVGVKVDENKLVDRAAERLLPLLQPLLKPPFRVQGTVGGVQVDLTIQTGDTTK